MPRTARLCVRSVACAVAVLGLSAGEARADLPAPRLVPELTLSKDKGVESAPEADPWTTRKKTINLVGGAPGGPTGIAGFSFEYAPIKYVVLGTGGGWSPEGVRAAFMPRLRLPLNRWFAVGLGFPFRSARTSSRRARRSSASTQAARRGIGRRVRGRWPHGATSSRTSRSG